MGSSGEDTTPTSSDVNLLTQKIYRRPVPLFYGVEQTPVLQFPISMYSPDKNLEVTAGNFSEIATWLFGQMAYKQLRLCQNDMQEIFFNCFLVNPQIIRVGNIIRAMTANVICDAPWGWKEPITHARTYDPNAYSVYDSFSIDNESANNFYTFPTNMIIQANIFGGSVTITNASDASRQFILTLVPNEIVTVNCDLQTITSNIVTYPLGGFNDNFLRFIQGTNNLNITGNIKSFSLTYPVAVKISG
jgi:phage-related protein